MAERTGMDRAGLSRLENGLTNPTFETIGRYALALNKRVVIELEDYAPVEIETEPVEPTTLAARNHAT
jgi:transcriptional regulator with XRE-family HTH domain